MLRIIIALIYDTFVICLQICLNDKNREKKTFKDEGVGIEYSSREKMALSKYVISIKLVFLFYNSNG